MDDWWMSSPGCPARCCCRRRKDGKLVPGPDRVTPFLGGLIEMVRQAGRQAAGLGGWLVCWLVADRPVCYLKVLHAAPGSHAASAAPATHRSAAEVNAAHCDPSCASMAATRLPCTPVPPPLSACQVMDPYSFWERQKDNANVTSPGYSYNSLFGKMIVTVTDAGTDPPTLQLASTCTCTCRLPAHRPLIAHPAGLPPAPVGCRQVPRADGSERPRAHAHGAAPQRQVDPGVEEPGLCARR